MTHEPDGMQSPDPGLDRLTNAASALLEELEVLGHDTGRQFTSLAKKSKQNRRMILVVFASLALDVVLTAAMGVGLVRVDGNAHRIDELTHRLDVSQSDTRQKALCPLYQLFRDSKSPAGRNAAPDPKAYDHAFQVIEDGYRVLDCKSFADGDQSWTGNTPKG